MVMNVVSGSIFPTFGKNEPYVPLAFRLMNLLNIIRIESMSTHGAAQQKTSSILNSLRARKKKTNRIDSSLTDTQEVIYTVSQLAEELGTTPAAIRKRIARGFIPAHKEGRKLIILKSEYVGSLRER